MISFNEYLNEALKAKALDEDAVVGGDAGAASAGEVAAPTVGGDPDVVDHTGIGAEDVLGKNDDHSKNGYLGPGCFHVPSAVLGKGNTLKREILAGKKKKSNKNPYEKDMVIIGEDELNGKILFDLHKYHEEDIAKFLNTEYHVEEAHPVGIVFCPVTKTFFIKFMEVKAKFVEVDMKNGKLVKVSDGIMTVQEVKKQFAKLDLPEYGGGPDQDRLRSMKFWIVWGGLF